MDILIWNQKVRCQNDVSFIYSFLNDILAAKRFSSRESLVIQHLSHKPPDRLVSSIQTNVTKKNGSKSFVSICEATLFYPRPWLLSKNFFRTIYSTLHDVPCAEFRVQLTREPSQATDFNFDETHIHVVHSNSAQSGGKWVKTAPKVAVLVCLSRVTSSPKGRQPATKFLPSHTIVEDGSKRQFLLARWWRSG